MDVKALNSHRQMDVKLNEFAKRILMLLPLLLLLLLLLHVLCHVLIQGREAPPCNCVVSTYSRCSSRCSRGSSIKISFSNSFSLTSQCPGMLRATCTLTSPCLWMLALTSTEPLNILTSGGVAQVGRYLNISQADVAYTPLVTTPWSLKNNYSMPF